MILKNSFLFLMVLVFIACGGGGTTTTGTTTTTTATGTTTTTASADEAIGVSTTVPSAVTAVTVSGIVTYDSVPFKSGGTSGLDYNNITQKPVRGAVVEIIDSAGTILGTTSTSATGAYSMSVTGTTVKVRVSAKLYKAVSSGQSSWDFQVKDNTNSNALYVMEGSLVGLGDNSTQTRNLNASSGWGGSSYSGTRVAGPFSILDVVYQAVEKVTTAQVDAIFGSLDIFWSKNNVAVSGTKSLGQISTSHFDGTSVYLLGRENSDTDEYDTRVVAHEWGHYYENKFSRSDSIGGAHGAADMLDIRLAFGEGFGTALGCIIIGSPLYLDSLGSLQGNTGVFADLEAGGSRTNPGWYNEASVYSIVYDVYDSTDDIGDTLSLGFTPIHNLLIGAQKNTEAFTSIFTFITALKAESPGNDAAIDAITTNESIAPITDIYGTGRTNRVTQNANPLYTNLSLGGSVNFTTDYSSTSTTNSNKLGAYNFVTFTIATSGTYTIRISQLGGSGTPDPDMFIYASSSNQIVASATATGITDSITTTLAAGTYRMSAIIYSQNSGSTFTVTLN